MVDTTLPTGRRAATAGTVVVKLSGHDAIRERLLPEGTYAAYGLAQLAPRLLPATDCWSAGGTAGSALVLHSRGGLGHAMLCVGDPTALDAILSLHPGPRFSFASFRPEQRPVLRRHFMLSRDELMVRMSVTGETFRHVETQEQAVRLRGDDIGRINRLYSSETGPAAYTSRHINEGVYYGVMLEDRLVAIAGTHVNSPGEGVAVVGNVFTHPHYRGGGLATIATSAVTSVLLQDADTVALTVEARNRPALAVYDKLGYRQVCTLYETPVVRKDALGVASAVRRLLAGWRGRLEGKEIVSR
ncbi:MAG: GNAT family N-acetyltransferase [Dehalococcoidia bacterium]